MPRVTRAKIGAVLIREMEPRRWRASWTDPLTKKWVRRVLPVSGYQEAVRQAEAINAEIAQGQGFEGRLRGSTGPTVADAVLEAVQHTNASENTRQITSIAITRLLLTCSARCRASRLGPR